MSFIPKHIRDLKSYDPGKPIEDVMAEYGIDHVVKLASNENPLGVSPLALQSFYSSINHSNRYPDIESKVLRTKLAKIHDLNMSNVITAHGSEAILLVILRTVLQEGDEVLTSEGTFIGFYVMINAMYKIKMNLVPLKNYRFDLDGIANSITPNTKIIYLVNPNNPTGNIFTKAEFNNFYEKVPDNVLIIMDEAYYEFVSDNPEYPDSMQYRYDNVITLRTFSKAYGLAGIRLGYGFGHEDLIKNFTKVRLPFEPHVPAQRAGVAALNDHDFLKKYIELNKNGLQFLYNLYDELGIKYIKSDANFVMSIYDSEEIVIKITRKLLEKGVIVRGLKAFGLPNCIRVTAGLEEENIFYAEKLKEVLKD